MWFLAPLWASKPWGDPHAVPLGYLVATHSWAKGSPLRNPEHSQTSSCLPSGSVGQRTTMPCTDGRYHLPTEAWCASQSALPQIQSALQCYRLHTNWPTLWLRFSSINRSESIIKAPMWLESTLQPSNYQKNCQENRPCRTERDLNNDNKDRRSRILFSVPDSSSFSSYGTAERNSPTVGRLTRNILWEPIFRRVIDSGIATPWD